MPRDYKNIKKEAQKKKTPSAGSFLNFLSGLSLGLFIAVIVNAMQAAEAKQTTHIEEIVERLEAKIDRLEARLTKNSHDP